MVLHLFCNFWCIWKSNGFEIITFRYFTRKLNLGGLFAVCSILNIMNSFSNGASKLGVQYCVLSLTSEVNYATSNYFSCSVRLSVWTYIIEIINMSFFYKTVLIKSGTTVITLKPS
jgi:hypothetical protein